ncbi:MAG: class I SAM-dependent methyltransferase [Gammaproteobacteria bacterium]
MNSDYDDSTGVRVDVTIERDGSHHRNSLLLNGVELRRVADALGRYCSRWGVSAFSELESSPPRPQTIAHRAFGEGVRNFARVLPIAGRRYPARVLSDAPPGVQSFLVVAVSDDSIQVDYGHPLRGLAVDVSISEVPATPALPQRRELPLDDKLFRWLDMGPGLQLTRPVPLDELAQNPLFSREDENDDAVFYAPPRMVQHIDSWARETMAGVFSEQLAQRAHVLDLMSSWVTHLPGDRDDLMLHGLGMNERELAANPRLSQFVVHDLNNEPALPFEPGSLDAVICAVSIEYTKRPVGIFRAVRDVLKPGGVFINAFSDRCFPTKAIKLWAELHPFERMAFVASCHEAAGGYDKASTFALAGAPRPPDDDYAMQIPDADAVYAVWARKR